MKNLIVLIAALSSLSSFANERVEIAKSYVGKYSLKQELNNDTKSKCSPELVIKYWGADKLLDLQFLSPADAIVYVDLSPVTREFLENSHAFDIVNKVNVSEDEKYKTVTRINSTRIEERTYKGKPDKYKVRSQVYLSKNIFNNDARFEFVNKKNKSKECLYSKL